MAFGENLDFRLGYGGAAPSATPLTAAPSLGLNMPEAPISSSAGFGKTPTTAASAIAPTGAFASTGAVIGDAITPGIGKAIGAGVGAVLDLGISLWGEAKQAKADQENREAYDRWQAIQNEIAEKEKARRWKWLEEDRSYSRAMDFQKGLWSMLQSDVALKNNLVNLYRRAA